MASNIPPASAMVLSKVPALSESSWPAFKKGLGMYLRAVGLPGIISGVKPASGEREREICVDYSKGHNTGPSTGPARPGTKNYLHSQKPDMGVCT